MKEACWLLLVIGLRSTLAYNNLTLDEESSGKQWETEGSCSAGKWGACLEGGALASFSALVGREFRLSKSAKLVQTELPDQGESKSSGSDSIFTKMARMGDNFVKYAGLEIELTPEITEDGKYQPRFVDEIYTELDTLELKKAKPHKQSELKRMFIPLLFILKIFKLKLLILLPFILGLASFKKVVALAILAIPALIAYFKVCKPDISQSYGSYGHSNYYQPPTSYSHNQPHYSEDGMAYDRMSYRKHADRLAYQGYR